jgi:cell wall-associated NlpC family hydrolase
MHGIDGAKTRVFAVAMTFVAAIQLWPNASADEKPKTEAVQNTELKAPKKKKKKTTEKVKTVDAAIPWTAVPTSKLLAAAKPPAKESVDPIAVVLKTAHKQLGKPYVWAAVGPNAFDCSGFTMYVWQKAGVHLPHNSGAQRGATKPVALDKARPGDLIFSSGHVGLYIGKGKMIHAPHSGRVVEIAPLHSNAYGAGRPAA